MNPYLADMRAMRERQAELDGPAEEAPKDKEALRPIEPVPATPRRLRRLELFDLNGYMRMRGDYFHRLGLGLVVRVVDPHGVPGPDEPVVLESTMPHGRSVPT